MSNVVQLKPKIPSNQRLIEANIKLAQALQRAWFAAWAFI